jgi:hypothetical protein
VAERRGSVTKGRRASARQVLSLVTGYMAGNHRSFAPA